MNFIVKISNISSKGKTNQNAFTKEFKLSKNVKVYINLVGVSKSYNMNWFYFRSSFEPVQF